MPCSASPCFNDIARKLASNARPAWRNAAIGAANISTPSCQPGLKRVGIQKPVVHHFIKPPVFFDRSMHLVHASLRTRAEVRRCFSGFIRSTAMAREHHVLVPTALTQLIPPVINTERGVQIGQPRAIQPMALVLSRLLADRFAFHRRAVRHFRVHSTVLASDLPASEHQHGLSPTVPGNKIGFGNGHKAACVRPKTA